jgi:hypothetical protein
MQADRQLAQISKRLVKEAGRGGMEGEESEAGLRGGRQSRSRAGSRSSNARGSSRGRSQAQSRGGSQARSRSSSGGRSSGGRRSQSGHGARPLVDHEEIRQWAEERGAQPACVRGTGGRGDTGMVRLDFPGYSGGESLQPISWDDWFEKFDERGLALLVQDTTARGQKSNFNKLVKRGTLGQRPRARAAR